MIILSIIVFCYCLQVNAEIDEMLKEEDNEIW